MTTADQGRVYEITVLGAVGPALRAALEPCRTAPSDVSTIASVTYEDDRDLIEVVRLLAGLGLEVTNVTCVEGAGRHRAAGARERPESAQNKITRLG